MQINKLILEGLAYLSLNRIDYLEINPESTTQIIIGTNGAGKTTVLRELSPLPGNPADFRAGGRKEFHCTADNGIKYEALSTFTAGKSSRNKIKGHHSLIEIKDGVRKELNDGGTLTVQRQLVKRIFGITPDIMEILVGDRRFTGMTAQERKRWISDMHRNDVTLAIKAYNVFSKRLRAAETNRKYIAERIAQETRRLKAMTGTEEAARETNKLMLEMRELLKSRSNQDLNIEEVGNRLVTAQLRLVESLKDFRKRYPPRLSVAYDNRELTSIEAINSEQAAVKRRLDELIVERDQNARTLSELTLKTEAFTATSVEELRAEKTNLEEQIKTNVELSVKANKEAVEYLGVSDHISVFFETFNGIVSKLEYLLLQMPENEAGLFSRERETALNETLNSLKVKETGLKTKIGFCEHEMRRIEEAVDVICPNCEHNLKHDVSKYDHETLATEHKTSTAALADVLKQIAKTEEDLKELLEFTEQLSVVRNIMKETPELKPMWAMFIADQLIVKSPASCLSIVRDVSIIENHRKDALKLERQNNEMSMRVKDIELILAQDLSANTERASQVTKRLEDLNTDIAKCRSSLTDLAQASALALEVTNHARQIETYRSNVLKAIEEWNTVLKDKTIDGKVESLHASYNTYKRRLEEKTNIESIIADNESELRRVTHDIDHLKLIVESLSPQSGLIAEQFVDFIRLIVQDMNDVIENIWAYELEVEPCSLDEQDLDYKFPFRAKNSDRSAKDVVLGSKAQKSIFDFAFKIVAARYLGLKNYPMIIDELGADMDPKHRDSIMREVKAMVDKREFSQLWVVSHYASQYGVFVSPDVLVLDEANVMVPARYNDHVVIR